MLDTLAMLCKQEVSFCCHRADGVPRVPGREIWLASFDAGGVGQRCQSVAHPVKRPLVGDAFQFVLAGVFELEPGACGEAFDRGAGQNLPGAGERADPGAGVDRQAADVVAGEFDLAGVAPARMSRPSSPTAAARDWAPLYSA